MPEACDITAFRSHDAQRDLVILQRALLQREIVEHEGARIERTGGAPAPEIVPARLEPGDVGEFAPQRSSQYGTDDTGANWTRCG